MGKGYIHLALLSIIYIPQYVVLLLFVIKGRHENLKGMVNDEERE